MSGQPLVFPGDVPHLQPQLKARTYLFGLAGDLEQAVAEEVDDTAVVRWA